jgi:REP element-mobilizing transposase RayT
LERLTGDDEIHQARRAMFREMEYWLEKAPTVTHLTKPEIARIVIDSIESMAERRVWLPISYTLMPNHLHLFIRLADMASKDEPRPLSLISSIQDFKRWTAREAAKELGIPGTEFWQREWFDHWSRGPESDERIRRYIRMNAVKAGLAEAPEDWPYFWERR